ncbi:MAG: NAD-dependent malic enzyme [Pigmentiphaga sp.]
MTFDTSIPRGQALLDDAQLNRATAFTIAERRQQGLLGLLPEKVETENERLQRVLRQIETKTSDLDRYEYLSALHDNDETLYFKMLMSDPARFMPLVYTPTVGEACQKFDHILRRPRGLYLPIHRKDELEAMLRNWVEPDVRFIVVTDGERILGLGDQGIGGMGIPIGKLSLYTACAGVPPKVTLPITLDVGTNNQTLLGDPLYLGLKQPRATGAEYDDFIEAFVAAVQKVFPQACIQFEDFAFPHAAPILARYRDRVCCFNDDIQGTASVALAGIITALRITHKPLTDQRVLFFGAGTAGAGIAGLLVKALIMQGLSENEARQRCWLFDVHGLLQSQRCDLADFQKPFAHEHEPVGDFVTAIRQLRPTAIIGVSTVGKAFNQAVIEAMAEINERPIIFPYSNPTTHSECSAEDAYRWSGGRAVFASGSPYPPVHESGRTLIPGQGNNVYIFPAMGMAIYATSARRVTDEMFIVAAQALAEQVKPGYLEVGLIYPPQKEIYEVSLKVAAKVAAYVFDHGLAGVERPAEIEAYIAGLAYQPEYPAALTD